jgi:hypothetical protein
MCPWQQILYNGETIEQCFFFVFCAEAVQLDLSLTELYRQQVQVIYNLENEYVHNIGQGKVRHRKYKRVKLDNSQAYNHSND